MRKTKRLLCIVIVLALAVSLFAFPASADNSVSEADYPFVLSTDLWAGAQDRILTR